MAKKLKSRATEKSGVYMVSVLRNWLLIFFLATSRGWSPSRRPPAKSNGYFFFLTAHYSLSFPHSGAERDGSRTVILFIFFNLLVILFQLATTVGKAEIMQSVTSSCTVSHHHTQCHIIHCGQGRDGLEVTSLLFVNFFNFSLFFLAKRQRCNGTLLDLNRLRETGLVASFFFSYLFWWNGSPPNFLFLQLATTVGKSALDVASAAMTAQDKITAAAMAAPAKIYR